MKGACRVGPDVVEIRGNNRGREECGCSSSSAAKPPKQAATLVWVDVPMGSGYPKRRFTVKAFVSPGASVGDQTIGGELLRSNPNPNKHFRG